MTIIVGRTKYTRVKIYLPISYTVIKSREIVTFFIRFSLIINAIT